jgi:drug/metabolite transporter (DMT)-like permease
MTSLVIIVGRAVLGLPILPAEGFGAVTGFVGAAICADDASRTVVTTTGPTSHASSSYAMLGNIVALSASFGTAAYLIIAKKLRTSMDLFVFMFTVMGLGSLLLLVFMFLSGETVSFDMHPVHGVFGWLNLAPDRLPLEMYMAIVCNCLGTYRTTIAFCIDCRI